MQKLTKELVKQLIYEVMSENQVKQIDKTGLHTRFQVGSEIHEVPNEEVDDFLAKYTKEDIASITKESIDRIIREEVQAHYGDKQ
jgi:hypothetical protein